MDAEDARVFLEITGSTALDCEPDLLLRDCIRGIREKELRRKNEFLHKELMLMSENDDDRITEIMGQMKKIDAEIQHLRNSAGE